MRLRYCEVCGSYTLKEEHCGKRTRSGHPPKFSPVDKYGEYRRKAKGML
ncbi:MAG: nucleolar RNA-binding Nop10p family protein [Candidatus Diapherotrites archaeon]|nr:nucleolar RNA-binding Nop10p family protein [Candidatus Diapherotrites archaeon]